MKRVLIPILLVVLLLAGCAQNGTEVQTLESEVSRLNQENTALQSRVTQLEEQLAEKEAGQDKNEAIVQFAQESLELQRAFNNVALKWREWWRQSILEFSDDNYPRYKTRSKEVEAINQLSGLFEEVRNTISTIELLYAPPEAIETKRKLLTEVDLLSQAFVDIINFYASPDSQPHSLYEEAQKFIQDYLGEIDKDVRRELTDLVLEYGQ